MAKLTLADITSGYAAPAKYNSNNTAIETAVENTLSRDGTEPNNMEAPLDMDGHLIINLSAPVNANDAARLQDVQDAVAGAKTAALTTITDNGGYYTGNNVEAALQEIGADLADGVLPFYERTAAEISAAVTPVDFSIPSHDYIGRFLPDRYGTVDRTGAVSSRAAIQTAITVARAAGGGVVDLTEAGNYLIDGIASNDSKTTGILIPYSADEIEGGGTHKRIELRCASETNLLAGTNGMIVIRCSDSQAQITGFPTIRDNGKTSVWGLGLVPEDMTQTSTCVYQTYCQIEVIIRGCSEGVVLAGGPQVAGRDSGCWYNHIHMYAFGCTRGLWLKDATTTSTLANTRNYFTGRIGQPPCNTGVEIDCGSENQFNLHFEGILTGTSPNTTPTAVKIETSPSGGSENTHNQFWGSCEAVTRQFHCIQDDTVIKVSLLDESACLFTQRPKTIITRQSGGSGDSLVEASEVRGAQRLSVTGSDAPIVLNDSKNTSRFSTISSNAGASANFNGVRVASNTKQDGTQGNAALSSWRADIGGFDATGLSGSGDAFSVDRKPAGGAWAAAFRIKSNGVRRYFGSTPTTVGAAGGGSALPATPVGYVLIDIGGTEFKIPYYNS